MKIAIAQINCTVGDLEGNAARILDYVERARAAGADLVLAPELSLCGYMPEDLLLRDSFYRDCDAALAALADKIDDIVLVVGHPQQAEGRRFNAASVLRGRRIEATYRKLHLPNYTVFDEKRYFTAGIEPCVIDLGGIRLGINICADVWERPAPALARAAGADVLLVLNASPFHVGKQPIREDALRERVRETGMAVVYANTVGGQDELVFDGASFVMNSRGEVTQRLPLCEEALGIVELQGMEPVKAELAPELTVEETVYRVLCLGVRDYIEKNGFPGVLLGLSGGIDSALVLAIAADALGPHRVRAAMLPSPYTSQMSFDDAREMARILGVRYDEIPIARTFDAFLETLAHEFAGLPADTTEENLQARIRGTLLMALSNKYGALVLTTSNKSESAVGYATLYGDMAGGFAVLKDVSKTLVYRIARWRNTVGHVIPERVITRPPSAELRPDQTDQDSLPPYDVLDAIMEAYVEYNMSPAEIVRLGYDADHVHRVVRLIKISEYKRRQGPVGIRITNRGFGKDWRFPITSRYRESM